MKKLGKKKPTEQMPENVTPMPVAEPAPAFDLEKVEVEVDFGAPNTEEQEALKNADDREEVSGTTKRLDAAVAYALTSFNLDNREFVVSAFADKGKKVLVSLVNADFDVHITFKDPTKFMV